MQSGLLQEKAHMEMKRKGKFTKETFNELLKSAGKRQCDLIRYVEKLSLKTEDDRLLKYNSSYVSNICREKSTRNPTKENSNYLKMYLKELSMWSDEIRLSAEEILACKQKLEKNEGEHDDGLDDSDYQEELCAIWMREEVDNILSDTMLCILYDNFNLFRQFNPVLWDTIQKLEKCTEVQRQKIKYEFKGKESRKLKKEEPKLKDILKFSWNCTIRDREQMLDEVMELWECYDIPLWDYLEVFAKMDEEIWKIVSMIILSDWFPQSEDFSPRIRKKLEAYFEENV